MKMGNLLTLTNTAVGQPIVIGLNGQMRLLKIGEQALPGELVINLPINNINADQAQSIQRVNDIGDPLDITQQVNEIISAIEEGIDPTLVDPEFAPAAGDVAGSSLGLSGTISRDGLESQPETLFSTQAINELSLSRSQSLALLQTLTSSELNPPSPDLPVTPPTDIGTPPSAVDDPIGFSLTMGSMALDNSVDNVGWEVDGATISASYGNVDGARPLVNYLGLLGVHGAITQPSIISGPAHQIQYDRNTQQSEKLSIKFDSPATQGRFAVTNLYAAEGEVFDDNDINNEVGVWIAYLDGVIAASGSFESITKGGDKMFVDIDTNGNAFDEIVFMANEYSLGVQGDTTNDSSDYFVAGIEVSSPGYYAVNQNFTANLANTLRIPIADILRNDVDPEGGALVLSQLLDANSGGTAVIAGTDIVFTPNANFTGITELEYEVVDEDGLTATAVINIVVNELPEPPVITQISMQNGDLYDGSKATYTVELDKPTLEETRLSIRGLSDFEIDYDNFTNGVTVENDEFVIPAGVAKFDLVLLSPLEINDVDISAYLSNSYNLLLNGTEVSENSEVIVADDLPSELNAQAGDDILIGSLSNDILIGGLGNDILIGGDGDDIFKWFDEPNIGGEFDTVADFKLGSDKLDLSDILADDISMADLLASVVATKESDNTVKLEVSTQGANSVEITLTNDTSPQYAGYDPGSIRSEDFLRDILTTTPDI